jgi:hypothetical protein
VVSVRRILGAIALLVVTACSGRPPARAFVRPDHGAISTEGVSIAAEARTFRLVTGHPFHAPFWSFDCPSHPTTRNFDLGERLGGQRVRVRHPAHPGSSLYGILSLCMIHPNASGPVLRAYDIRIPDSYVGETDGGRVAVVWEPSGVSEQFSDGSWQLPAWILWLSQTPFP